MTPLDLRTEAEHVARRLRERGQWVTDDLRVRAEVAAEMLDKSAGTLRNWRAQEHPLPYVGGPGVGVSYYLTDLLAYIRAQRHGPG